MSIMRLGLTSAILLSLAACGGGSGGDAVPSEVPDSQASPGNETALQPPEIRSAATGLWTGQTSNDRTVMGIVLSTGTYYVFYSQAGDPNIIGGVVQGSGTVSADSFTSSDAKDFNAEGLGVLAASVTATATSRDVLSGEVRYSGSSFKSTFSTTYNTDFDVAPSFAAIAGSYDLTVKSSAAAHYGIANVSATGAISALVSDTSNSGGDNCSVSGSISPRSDGNVYDITVTFGSSPCLFAGESFTTVAYYDSRTGRLYAAAPNGTRTDAALLLGERGT